MNRVLLLLSAALLARRSSCAYPQYDHPHQATGLQGTSRGYQGPPVVPVILPGGFIADTEEVAKAKDLHFNAYAHAASATKDSRYNPQEEEEYSQPRYTKVAAVQQHYSAPQQTYSRPQQSYSQPQQSYSQPQQSYSQPQPRQQDYNVPQHRYTGPAAGGAYTSKSVLSYQPSYPTPRYQGPPAVPVVLPNGYIAETADVEAAKEHHFQLVAKAQAAVARAQERLKGNYGYTHRAAYAQPEDDGSQYDEPDQNYNQVVYQSASSSPVYSRPRQQYQGPPVVPVILPTGHIADTAEVAAAKISHLQQLLDAAQKSQPQQRYHASR